MAEHGNALLAAVEAAALTGSARLAHVLGSATTLASELHRQGVRPGDRIAWIGPNDMGQIVLFFACARLGAFLVPLNWRLSVEELRWIEQDAGLRLVCAPVGRARGAHRWTHAWLDDLAARRAQGAPAIEDPATLSNAAGADGQLAAELVGIAVPHEDAPVLLCYTSGTTGRPKGAVLTQRAIMANAASAHALFEMKPQDRVLTVLPMFHVGGLNIQTIPALLAGAEVLLLPRFEPDAFFDAITAEQPTLTLLVPAVMRALVTHPRWRETDLSCLRAIGAGSSEVPLDLIEAFHAKGVPVQQVYGATETCPIAIAQTRAEALAAPGSIGRPAPGVEARLAAGTNEIEIRGPNVMAGYWNQPEATAAVLRDGWFSTGDVGRVDADGRWWFTDRLKHVIISGGENIYPAEVERVLASAPGVAEGAVIGRADPRWGEVPVAVVVPGPGYDPARVRAHLEAQIARFKLPREILAVEALPRTALGKVASAELKALVECGRRS